MGFSFKRETPTAAPLQEADYARLTAEMIATQAPHAQKIARIAEADGEYQRAAVARGGNITSSLTEQAAAAMAQEKRAIRQIGVETFDRSDADAFVRAETEAASAAIRFACERADRARSALYRRNAFATQCGVQTLTLPAIPEAITEHVWHSWHERTMRILNPAPRAAQPAPRPPVPMPDFAAL